ncbi:hypothetical protein GUJ93_ZPchr0007g6300 [Zizania palustris]|uniref:Uncharacterized protein n=1 Tax=Zizania palustris TaxID=103762 RepID=A0A8J5SPR8_ZIZPA|nr:hypothetical protein GUJ93_ZPchr0007g6300 [Zizania palustris]
MVSVVVVRRATNKLSERIVKCLICIFIRLLRSSRQAKLEKLSTNYMILHLSLAHRAQGATAAEVRKPMSGQGAAVAMSLDACGEGLFFCC